MRPLHLLLTFLIVAFSFGQTVEPFAPEVFGQLDNVRDFTISANENEAYFTLQSPMREFSIIMRINKQNNTWQEPEIASFSGQYTDLEAALSPDGLKLYFASNRPISADSTNAKDYDIWYVERQSQNTAWSEPINAGNIVNSKGNEFYPSVAANGNIYFTLINEEAKTQDDIYVSYWKEGTYTKPTVLKGGLNTEKQEYNAFVAPDERYIIFGSWRRDDALGSGDMYISFRNDDGSWSEAKNFGGPINSKYMEFCPFVDGKGNLFFTSRRSSITKKEGGFGNYQEIRNELNKYSNGFSRIYKVNAGEFLKKEN